MKKLSLLLILLLPLFAVCQSDRQVSGVGQLDYQYSRTFERNPKNPQELVVTFVFVNGNAQRAIMLRQQVTGDPVRWISVPNGQTGKESVVATATANLAPKQSIVWKYAVKTDSVAPATTALMVMSDDFGVEKIVLKD